jgi:4-hydroxythreonine-4-phosphate dehydrogenase
MQIDNKPIIGFSCGDVNGIGIEIIIKSLANSEILNLCTPVIFANNKVINFYKKGLADINLSLNIIKDFSKLSHKQINVFNCWEEEVNIAPGELNDIGGKYAYLSLQQATESLKAGDIDALVTAPIHKKNIQNADFKHSGHTPYFKEVFAAKDVLMLMCAENLKVGLVTEHLPIAEVGKAISKEAIVSKLNILHKSLQEDFGISKPKIAVLGLNPHAGDESLIGKEEKEIIKPAINSLKDKVLAFGPFSSDAFFARGSYQQFDAVLAMYHDQGLIPFKSLSIGEGVNYTAGLQVVRTSPDHGTAFDIAGKNKANFESFLASIFMAIDILNNKIDHKQARQNPLRKMSGRILANAVDE